MRRLGCEYLKMRHTPLRLLHLWIPALAGSVFLMYFRYARWDSEQEVCAYVEAIGIVFPFLSALICCLAAELEEAGRYQLLFLGTGGKWRNLAGKWIALLLLALGATALSVAGFGLLYGPVTGDKPFGISTYFLLILTLWGGQIPVYLLHLLLAFWFGRSTCILTGVGEAVLAALFLTGLGDGRWMFFPCVFSGRWSACLLSYKKTGVFAMGEWIVSIGIALLIIGAAFVCFYYYEGRRCED